MRGQASQVGDTRTANNGYHYTKTVSGWRLTHHIVVEKLLGRAVDTSKETIRFKDRNRSNLSPDNIVVTPRRGMTKERRIAQLQAKIDDLTAQLEDIMTDDDQVNGQVH